MIDPRPASHGRVTPYLSGRQELEKSLVVCIHALLPFCPRPRLLFMVQTAWRATVGTFLSHRSLPISSQFMVNLPSGELKPYLARALGGLLLQLSFTPGPLSLDSWPSNHGSLFLARSSASNLRTSESTMTSNPFKPPPSPPPSSIPSPVALTPTRFQG